MRVAVFVQVFVAFLKFMGAIMISSFNEMYVDFSY